jgi:choline-sulfatase
MSERPNLLVILTDQQSASMMGCAENPYVRTPAMDRLAAEGVRFDRAYCTNPVCIASRFSLLTGRMPSEIGLWSNRTAHLNPVSAEIRHEGLGHLMRQAGYETAYGGKVHLPKMGAEDVGFDVISTDERARLSVDCAAFLQRRHPRPFCLVASFINPHDICYMAIRDMVSNEPERRLIETGRVECATLDAALQRPPTVDDAAFFGGLCPPLPPNFEAQQDEPEAIRRLLEIRPFRGSVRARWSAERWREHRWAYARLTDRVDAEIGHLTDALRASAFADNTVVVFTSDHGDMDAVHRMEHKSTYYDAACRIPLIVTAPGLQTRGRVDPHLVSNGLDLVPTLCDYAGVAAPSNLAGRSWRPLVEGTSPPVWRDAVPVEHAFGHAIVTEHFKHAVADVGSSAEQLIDLQEDPWETRNAVHDRHHAARLAALRGTHLRLFPGPFRDEATVLADMTSA